MKDAQATKTSSGQSSKNGAGGENEWQYVEEPHQRPQSRYQSSNNSGYREQYRGAFAFGNRGNYKKPWQRNRERYNSQYGSNHSY